MWATQPNIQTTDEESEVILKLTSAFIRPFNQGWKEGDVIVNEVMVNEGHL